MKKLMVCVAIIVAAYFGIGGGLFYPDVAIARTGSADDTTLSEAFFRHANNIQVTGSGVVAAILPEDDNGSRHQLFIVRLETGQTVLIAHNIDIAPRVASLNEGDSISFKGEYEWNSKGGVIHWTHHDPDGDHPAGWLKHDGHFYR